MCHSIIYSVPSPRFVHELDQRLQLCGSMQVLVIVLELKSGFRDKCSVECMHG